MVTRVTIVGAPVACGVEVKDTWRELATWLAGELRRRYGEAVEVDYHDLFDPDRPTLPVDAQLPLVFLDGRVLSSGGKLSMPVIRKALDALGMPSRPRERSGGVRTPASAETASRSTRS